ncbi:MAG: UPF0175 family protein [Caldilineaceae bacterium]
MSLAITLEIPDDIAENYPTDGELKRTMLENIVINEFQKGLLSIGQSAELLGLTYEGFIELLGEHRLPFITATPEELEASYQAFSSFMETYPIWTPYNVPAESEQIGRHAHERAGSL